MNCETCRHQDRTGYTPTCRKAGPPNACVLAWARSVDAQARAGKALKCQHWEKR